MGEGERDREAVINWQLYTCQKQLRQLRKEIRDGGGREGGREEGRVRRVYITHLISRRSAYDNY